MERHYAIAKLVGAACTLMTHPGALPDRVRAASSDLGLMNGHEDLHVDSVQESLETAKGDLTKVPLWPTAHRDDIVGSCQRMNTE